MTEKFCCRIFPQDTMVVDFDASHSLGISIKQTNHTYKSQVYLRRKEVKRLRCALKQWLEENKK